MVRVSVIQHDIAWHEPATTLAALEPRVAASAAAGAPGLVVLTEMFATGFSMHPESIAEPAGGSIEQWLITQAGAHNTWIVGSIAQWGSDGRAVNVAVLADPAGRTWRYEKMHPFTYAGEHEHYRAGDKPLTVDIEGDDFWALARDTDCYVVVANWPQARREHWRALLTARAIENQAYVVGANRVGPAGHNRDLDHCGDSAIIDPLARSWRRACAPTSAPASSTTSAPGCRSWPTVDRDAEAYS